MGKPLKWAAALCAVCVCAIALMFVVVPVGPLNQGGTAPFKSVADTLANDGQGSESGAPAQAAEAPEGEDAQALPDEDAVGYEQGAVLVRLDEGLTLDQAREVIAKETDLQDVSIESLTDSVAKVTFSGQTDAREATKAIATSGAVESAQPNFVYYPEEGDASSTRQGSGLSNALGIGNLLETQAKSTINDPKATKWALEHVGAFDAWDELDKAKNPKNVTVAVIDEGFRLTHEDFTGNFVYNAKTGKYDKPLVVAPYNAYTGKAGAANIKTEDPHGTHVMGIIAAHANNAKGIAGVANNRVQVMPIQAFDVSGDKTNTASLVRALDYVVKKAKGYNVRVVNMSVGGGTKDAKFDRGDLLIADSISDAHDRGILCVTSAGNETKKYKPPFYHTPGDFEQTVSVINLENTNPSNPKTVRICETSNYNTSDQMAKDISAPGTDIMSAVIKSDSAYKEFSGTSMAAPMVAGIAGLMFSVDDDLTVDEAASKLYSAASPLYSKEANIGDPVWSRTFGYGSVNAYHAVSDEEYISGATSLYVNEKRVYKLNLPKGVKADPGKITWRMYKSVGGNVIACSSKSRKVTVKGKKAGSCILMAQVKVGDKTYRAVQTIVVYDADVTGPKKMEVGEREQFYSAWAPTGTNRKWEWKSSNPKVATVTSNGTVIARQKGTTTISVMLANGKTVTDKQKVTVKAADLGDKDLDLTASYKIPRYTGKALTPKFKLIINEGKKNEVTLVQGRDFKVAYSKNVNAGKNIGRAKITALPGSQLCTGSTSCTFTINPAVLDKDTVVKGVSNKKHTGRVVAQYPKVTLDGRILKKGTDFTLVYLNAKKKAVSAGAVKAKGRYYVSIVGKGNYTGTVTRAFKIV